MPMPLPEERVYYHERRECGDVLLCWIPRGELERMVSAGQVDETILRHHPGGLDVEVTPADTAYLRVRYGLELGRDPRDLLLAFEGIVASDEVGVVDEVRGSLVEELARPAADEAPPTWDERRPIAKDQAALVLKDNAMVQRRVDAGLRKLRTRSRSKRLGAKEKTAGLLQRIRRSKGDPPAVVFTRLQRQVAPGAE